MCTHLCLHVTLLTASQVALCVVNIYEIIDDDLGLAVKIFALACVCVCGLAKVMSSWTDEVIVLSQVVYSPLHQSQYC